MLLRTDPTVASDDQSIQQPSEFILDPVYPNPFNNYARISFSLPMESIVTIEIIDVLGRIVEAFPAERFLPGYHARQMNGESLSSGIYFCRITVQTVALGRQFQQVGRMTILK